MTPKIQKKINALQKKMQKKHPDYDINYVYDKKGKVYALSYNENTQQFVSLKNMKPVSQDTELFDVNDQPFSFNAGPDLYEVFDKEGNQTVLAFDKESAQFFNPETGEPVEIENYTDSEGNPIDPAQFVSDEQPNDSEVNSEDAQYNQEQEAQDSGNEEPASEPNNDFVEQKYEESVPTTDFQGLEYASPTVDIQQSNNPIPENNQNSNLNQDNNQQNNNFYPNDGYQPQENNYQAHQLPNQNYDQANNYQDSSNNFNQPSYQQPLATPQQNNYGYVDHQNNNVVDPNFNNYQSQNNDANLGYDNFNQQQSNQFENSVQQPQENVLNYKTIDSSTIPTTEVASSINDFAVNSTPIITVPETVISQPVINNNQTKASFDLKDNVVTPLLETVIDSTVDVKLDPISQDLNKPNDEFIVLEEPKKSVESNKQFIVSEEAASNDLFDKKTAEIIIDETYNRSIFSKPKQKQEFVISKPVIESEQSLPDSKVFITPEIRPQPQAVYSAAPKKEFNQNNSYSNKVNLKDFNPEQDVVIKPNSKLDLNSSYPETKPYQKPLSDNDYQAADFHDFEISKPIASEQRYDQNFSDYSEYEPSVQDYEYNPDEQQDLYNEKPYSSFRSYRNHETPRYYQNDNYLENSGYNYYKTDDQFPRRFNYQPLSTFRSSSTRSYPSLRSLDSSLLPPSRPSSHYPASRSLTVLIDNNYDSSLGNSRFRNYRSSYAMPNNYYRPSTYGYSSRRTLSDYGPYQVRSFKNWQPSSITSSINTYSMPLPSSYRGYSSRLRNYRNW